jgi:hypothetical protein
MANSLSELTKYGKRYGSNDYKQAGYFGEIPLGSGDVATEYSIGQDINGKNVEMPSIVSTLTYDELQAVKNSASSGAAIPQSVYEKALEHAKQRISSGRSPFWGMPEVQYELPQREDYRIIPHDFTPVNSLIVRGANGNALSAIRNGGM